MDCMFTASILSREVAETSPYYEALKKDDVEVSFLMSKPSFDRIKHATYMSSNEFK